MPKSKFFYRNKYYIAASLIGRDARSVLDVGARDRILQRFLSPNSCRYYSADMIPGHDFQIDLEKRLPFDDGQFDYVVALDVLEHVDRFHDALQELRRISSRGVIIGLPNLAEINHRISFVFRGRLSTDKYDLTTYPHQDRHRWLTEFKGIGAFFADGESRGDFRVVSVAHEVGGGFIRRAFGWVLLSVGLPFRSPLITRSIFHLTPGGCLVA